MSGVVAVIDAGGANLGSVRYALERLGATPRVIQDPAGLHDAARVILPGVGAAGPAMALLRARGFIEALPRLEVPLLGICLGMQRCRTLEEGEVDAWQAAGTCDGCSRARHAVRTWVGTPRQRRASGLMDGIAEGGHAYFVHGYAAPVTADCIAETRHGQPLAAVVGRGRVWGAQFHPERSAATGARLLANFIAGAA